jgi:hypothetical protein
MPYSRYTARLREAQRLSHVSNSVLLRTHPAQVTTPPKSQSMRDVPLLFVIASTTEGVTKIPVPNILFRINALVQHGLASKPCPRQSTGFLPGRKVPKVFLWSNQGQRCCVSMFSGVWISVKGVRSLRCAVKLKGSLLHNSISLTVSPGPDYLWRVFV